jgi:hypothetical protein
MSTIQHQQQQQQQQQQQISTNIDNDPFPVFTPVNFIIPTICFYSNIFSIY